MPEVERYEVHIWVADGPEGEDDCRYTGEHWFVDRPGIETLAGLFDEAKRDFAALYPDGEAVNFAVTLERLRHPVQSQATATTSQ